MTKSLRASACLLLALASAPAPAQTTDGYHMIQVIPVVVDTASFSQRFEFSTPLPFALTLHPTFYPADGVAQAALGPLACPSLSLPAANRISVASLRALCPALAAGSEFGFLRIEAERSGGAIQYNLPIFAAYSRVSNPQGAGFSVESFAANEFTSAVLQVDGARRVAATLSSPAFQTNCFVGNINQVAPAGQPVATTVSYKVLTGAQSYTASVNLLPGQMVRILDVFAAAGAPAGDYDGASIEFDEPNRSLSYMPGIIAFCTVQDNTSFGADFRIAKQTAGLSSAGANDDIAARGAAINADVLGRTFQLGAGQSANTHLVYFRHPDYANCRLLTTGFAELPGSAGMEMRMLDQEGSVIAGGNGMTGTGTVYLGDKPSHQGVNTRYRIEVENTAAAAGARNYLLYCLSGSGHTFGADLIEYQQAIDRF